MAKVNSQKEAPIEKTEAKETKKEVALDPQKLNIRQKLFHIQQKLQAPKGQYNSFGKYAYRSCEDILGAVKPLLAETRTVLRIEDNIEVIGSRIYVKATATLSSIDNDEKVTNTAFAREDDEKKGMDGSQVTGASSSYARKYALNGLFGIDDVKDADATNKFEKGSQRAQKQPQKTNHPAQSPELKAKIGEAQKKIAGLKTMDEFKAFKQSLPERFVKVPEVGKALVAKYHQLEAIEAQEANAQPEPEPTEEDKAIAEEAEKAFEGGDELNYEGMFE